MARINEAPAADVTETVEETPKQKAKATKESTKTPVEEGFVAPVEFAKRLSEVRGSEVRPQIVYGYLKNMKGFPQKDRGEGTKPRIVIPLEEGLSFLQHKEAEKAAKKAAKEEAAKA
jgi:hypothetical protein